VVVQLIFSKYIDGKSPAQIAVFLTQNKYPTPSSFKNNKESSFQWNDNTVRKILKNESYNGILNAGKERHFRINPKKNKQSEVYLHPNYYPVIIDDEIWKTSQEIMQNNQHKKKQKKHERYKYTGMLTCAECRKPFYYYYKTNQDIFYTCSTYRKYGETVCGCKIVSEKEIDKQILDELVNIKNQAKQTFNKLKDNAKEQVATLSKEIEKDDEEVRRLILKMIKYEEDAPEHQQLYNEMDSVWRIMEEKKKIVQLYQNNHSALTEILDVSDKIIISGINDINLLKGIISTIFISGTENDINFKIILKQKFDNLLSN